MDSTLSVYYERLLYDWVTNGIAEDKFQEIRQQFSLGTTGIIIVSRINKLNLHIGPLTLADRIKNAMFSRMESDEDYKNILAENEKRLVECTNYVEFKYELLNILFQFMSILQNNRSKKHEIIIETCLNYIDEHYMEDLSLDMVSNNLFFSPNYLSVIFKNHLGMTFGKYLSDLRIKKAIDLLQNSEMKVYEIASKIGFQDDKYFYRVFKSRFGLTPDEYRRNNYMNRNHF